MKRFAITALLLLCTAAVVTLFVLPVQAQALEIDSWTAKTNKDGGDGIMGATSTRITWKAQSDPEESLSSVSVGLPAGSEFDPANITVTVISGLDRLEVASTVTAADATTAKVDFAEPTPAGTLIMVEFNQAKLPGGGGSYGVSGSYTTADGQTHDMPQTDATIEVIGVTPPEQLASWLGDQPWVQAWNSNKFLHLFLDPQIAVTSIPVIFSGWLLALGLVILSFPLSIPVGLAWSFMRMANSRIIRALGSTYINIVRGTPLFLQIYIAFFGLPLLGVKLDNFALAIIVLVMNSSAYLAEIFRAGIQSISKGQFEASRSLGMNGAQTMIFVIVPQTIRRVIPTMTSEFILMYKDTSLLAAVGVMEIMMFSKTITAATGNVTPYIVAAAFYLIVTIPLTKIINSMEERMAGNRPKKHRRGGTKPPTLDPESAAVSKAMRMSETFAQSSSVQNASTAGSAAEKPSHERGHHLNRSR